MSAAYSTRHPQSYQSTSSSSRYGGSPTITATPFRYQPPGPADPLDAFPKPPYAPRLELPPTGSPFNPRLAPPSPRSASPQSTSSPLSPVSQPDLSPPAIYRRPSMPLGPDPSLPNNQYYPSSRGLTSSNDYDPYDPSRMSSASLHTIEIDWSQAYRPSTVVEDIPSRDFSGLEMQWATIFDARRHRKPALPASWFEDDWEVAGVYPNHVLFVHKAEKKRAVMVYNISETKISLLEVKYESAGLSYDGRFLLVTREKFLYVHSVETSKVIKKFKAKNIQIRKWTSNNRGFCWVDSDGRFWQWSYGPSEEPEQVFTLHARAPRYWLTPITTPDGEWYAICATEKDRRRGVVHCFPSDHGEARIFDGPAAATFAFVGNSERRGGRAKELAILLLSMVHDRDGSNIALEMRGLDRNSPLQRYGRSPISVAPSMKLLPELFVDPLSDLIIAGVSTASAENSLTLIFDPLTGKYVGNKKLNLNAGDRVYCGACGLHMEQNANVFRRLTIHPEGLPRPDSAGTGAAPIGSRRSFESWNSGDASSRHNRTGSVGGQGSSGGRSTAPKLDRNLGDSIGRAFAMGSAEDESWMYNR